MEKEIRELIVSYSLMVEEHRRKNRPVELTTHEECHLDGYDAALIRAVSDLKQIVYNNRESKGDI